MSRLGMGAVAFALLMSAEFELTAAMMYFEPTSLPQCADTTGSVDNCFLTSLIAPDRLLGLAGQIVFALMPWIALYVPKR